MNWICAIELSASGPAVGCWQPRFSDGGFRRARDTISVGSGANDKGRRTIRLLVVDDEQSIRRLCMTVGGALGSSVRRRERRKPALARSPAVTPDIALRISGCPIYPAPICFARSSPVSPHRSRHHDGAWGPSKSAVEAMKSGRMTTSRSRSVWKNSEMLLRRNGGKNPARLQENKVLRERVEPTSNWTESSASPPRSVKFLRIIGRLKEHVDPVADLWRGGTGKELVARAIHYRGAFAQRPL